MVKECEDLKFKLRGKSDLASLSEQKLRGQEGTLVKLRESVEVLNQTIDEEKKLSSCLSKRLENVVLSGQMTSNPKETAKKHNSSPTKTYSSGQKSSTKIISSKNDDTSTLENTALTRLSSKD